MMDELDYLQERLEIQEMVLNVVSEAADNLEKKLDQLVERFLDEN